MSILRENKNHFVWHNGPPTDLASHRMENTFSEFFDDIKSFTAFERLL